jgi:DNA invertase Pin-like site-specific DNA recombinase
MCLSFTSNVVPRGATAAARMAQPGTKSTRGSWGTSARWTSPFGVALATARRRRQQHHVLSGQAVTSGYGRIVAEYFDVGHSRTLPWARRPEAAAMPAMADPDRSFGAIVIGSSERAFCGSQFATMALLFEHFGVAVWVPELGGAVDPKAAGHDELMIPLGILAKREITRTRIRVRSAMTVQVRDQGRFLGGRPPYGYRLVDAGPHPNRAQARRGMRIQRLDIDPACGPVVTWIFAQRLTRHSMARIARALNDIHIPCPSTAGPGRNPHRPGQLWTLTTVRAILANPRYTGHQVWNRQRTDHDLIHPDNTALGTRDVMRWNTPEDWAISTTPAHPARSAKPASPPSRTSAPPATQPRTAPTCWPECCAAAFAGAGWNRAGPPARPVHQARARTGHRAARSTRDSRAPARRPHHPDLQPGRPNPDRRHPMSREDRHQLTSAHRK